MDPLVSDLERTAPLRHLEKMTALARLARGMSHDVGELLASAAASLTEARAVTDGEHPAHEALETASATLQRALVVARQLEVLAKPAPRHSEPRALGRTVAELLPLVDRLAGPAIAAKAATLDPAAWVVADAGQVEQVLFHLVVNARDAMPDGGTITLSVTRQVLTSARNHRFGIITPGEWVVLAVSDGGCGMDDQVLARLFEPFFTTKAPGQGSGLGLTTVYGIARQLGGQVMVESRPGQGTTIALWAPAVAAPAGAAALAGSPAAVLLVEDDEWVRAVTARALRRAGYGVLEATDAESALELLRDVAGQSVRVVLTDIVMPGMWGDALARRVAAERGDVRTVLMTGRGPELLVDRTLDGIALLRKPFSRHQLLAALAG